MSGPLKIALVSLLVSLYAVAQAFCACASSMGAEPPALAMTEISHHDHGTMHDSANKKEHPCEHCEQGVEKNTLNTNTAVIPAPPIRTETLRAPVVKSVGFAMSGLPDRTRERRHLFDPPPNRIYTPIALKTRLLT